MKPKDIKMGPSTRRIFRLSTEHLLKHYALIQSKASSLSSAQRKTVEFRVGYLYNKGTITDNDINEAIAELSKFVLTTITDKINKVKDDSSTEE